MSVEEYVRKKSGGRNIRGVSKCREFLIANVSCDTKACLIWPFCRNRTTGYGAFGYLGEQHYAHRYMCELVNGPPPTPEHEAAHSCGQGHMGCVHPLHLSWKSIAENVQDSWDHTPTPRNSHGNRGRLTAEQVRQIRELKGAITQAEIGRRFDVSAATVRDIFLGRSHRPDMKIHPFTAEEDVILQNLRLRKVPFEEISQQMGRTLGSLTGRLYRMRKSRTDGQGASSPK